jgi:hypothetical protein
MPDRWFWHARRKWGTTYRNGLINRCTKGWEITSGLPVIGSELQQFRKRISTTLQEAIA